MVILFKESLSALLEKEKGIIQSIKVTIRANRTNEELNELYDELLPAVTERYGNPQDVKKQVHFMGDRTLVKNAYYSEDGKYNYRFGAYRNGPAARAQIGLVFDAKLLK